MPPKIPESTQTQATVSSPARFRWIAVCGALAMVLATSGCSELPPPHDLHWKFERLPTHRGSLTGVVALAGDRVVIVGYDRPEGLVANIPIAFVLGPGGWTYRQLPDPRVLGSVQLNGVARGDDGSVWACGRIADYEPEPSRITPVIYRYAGGVWLEFAIEGLGDLDGVELRSIATRGFGASLFLTAVGSAGSGTAGAALTYTGGRWILDSLPPVPGTSASGALTAVARNPNGGLYAAGAAADGSAGVIYRYSGAGAWEVVSGLGSLASLNFSALAFDPDGMAWLGANRAVGDSLEGALFRYRSGPLQSVSISRRSAGAFKIHAIAFDAEGHGWVVGGRPGNDPFVAGLTGGAWTEWIPEIERDEFLRSSPRGGRAFPERASEIDIPGGGELHGVSVVSAEVAFTVGYKVGVDPKGFYESELSVYRLATRPLGEVDLVTRPAPER